MSSTREIITQYYLNQQEKIKNIIFGNLLDSFGKTIDMSLIEKITADMYTDLNLFIKKNHNLE